MIANSQTDTWPTYSTTATLTWWGQLDGLGDALSAAMAPVPGLIFRGAQRADADDWLLPTVVVTYSSSLAHDEAEAAVVAVIESVSGSTLGNVATMLQTVVNNAATDTATTIEKMGGVASDAWGGVQLLAIAAIVVGAAYLVAMMRKAAP